MDIKPTVKIIEKAADTLQDTAERWRRIAKQMREENDFSLVGEILSSFSNLANNLRLDLFFVRPWREHEIDAMNRLRVKLKEVEDKQ